MSNITYFFPGTAILPVQDTGVVRLANVDYRCAQMQIRVGLAIFSVVITLLFLIAAAPLNAVIINCIWTQRHQKFKGTFYWLLLNIAVADLLKATITALVYIEVNVKKAMMLQMGAVENYMMHLSLFYTDAVALLSVILLNIDRITAMLYPIQHHNGAIAKVENKLMALAWILSLFVTLPYIFFGFISHLLFFSLTVIGAAALSLLLTTTLYKYKLGNNNSNNDSRQQSFDMEEKSSKSNRMITRIKKISQIKLESDTDSPKLSPRGLVFTNASSRVSTTEPPSAAGVSADRHDLRPFNSRQGQATATKAFLFILVMFVFTYLPTEVMIVYMAQCEDCDCDIIHSMKNLSKLFILGSSLMRPLGFIFSLRHLHVSVAQKIAICRRWIQ